VTTATLEERRIEQKALCDGMLPSIVKPLNWSAEQLVEHRNRALRHLIRHAQENSPWIGKRVAHLDADSVTEDDLSSVTPMTKDDLLEHFDEIVTDRRLTLAACEAHLASGGDEYLFDEYRVMATGGTSGVRAVVPVGWDEFAAASAMLRRPLVRWMMTEAPFSGRAPVLARVGPVRGAHFSSHHGWLHGQPAIPIAAPIADIVASLNERQPDVLGMYPSLIPLLAAEAAAGRLTIAPRAVVCAGEPCFDDHRRAVEETWGAVVLDCYGATEVMWVAQGCACHDGLQLCEDRAVIELIDDDGKPVAAGETASTVLVTPLSSRTLPLIRYELTDRVTMATDRTPCAPAFRRLAAVDGRRDDAFTYSGGVVVHPIVFRSALLTERHVLEYQVRQTSPGADINILANGPIDADRLTKLVEANLSHAGVADPVVRVREVNSIARHGDGQKLPRMIPLPT
jgi:phenylacetate-coenzyme A ligase PaaK-like adenylate-forming protein